MDLYHSAKGSVNYTVVGSPTIVNGVTSGFSTSNCLTLTPISQGASFELNFRFTTTGATSGTFFRLGASAYRGVLEWIDSSHMRFSYRTNDSSTTVYKQFNATLNSTINYNMAFDSNTSTLVVTVDVENMETQVITVYNVDGAEFTSTARFGYVGDGRDPLNGSIDLNNTYITVNGQPWFGNCPIEVKKHQLMGPVGYTVVGSPTIVDGVASEFVQSTNYLTVGTLTNSMLSNAEFVIRATVATARNTALFYCISNLFWLWVSSSGKINFHVKDAAGNGSFDLPSSFTTDTYFNYKVSFKNDIASIYFAPDNSSWQLVSNVDLTGMPSFSNMLTIGRNDWYWSTGYNFGCSVDLNHTYIKVNGKLWFYQPAPSKYIQKDSSLVFADPGLYLSGPNNYTVVGTPTIVDNVVSGFSTSNYLTVSNFSFTAPELVIKTKYRHVVNDTTKGHYLYFYSTTNGTYNGCLIRSNGYFAFTNSISSQNVVSETTVTPEIGQDYEIEVRTDINTYFKAYINNNLVLDLTYTGVSGNSTTDPFKIGLADNGLPLNTGSIDLNNTYVTVNGDLWFYGKNYATKNIAPVPAGYTYGNTTTSAIGWVDMRTQAFTAAPSGATIGRDEQ